MKQLSGNACPDSRAKTWNFFVAALATFPPPRVGGFDTVVAHFLKEHAPPDKREAAYQALRAEVMGGDWWKQYKGKIQGAITAAVQKGMPVILIGIQGGPITQLEQREMAGVVDLIKADLVAQGLKPRIEMDMNIPTYQRFAEKYAAYL